jgi:hypothetical protein
MQLEDAEADATADELAGERSTPSTMVKSNLRSVKRRLQYVEWAREVAKGLAGVSDWLEGEFEEAAQEAEHSTAFHRRSHPTESDRRMTTESRRAGKA